ncbi:MAG TPA: NUDIX domain-containing protein [Stackebrandtia sp.]|uniref:NUDIX hydrolase n=1 Tax=Stackebrandtia sp. TaxID=2023065 RepID=UPI002D594F7F|nr:NUDIX domain-containing protein [Stackebrandtia sp.]HZE37591.1 NUDIX domain-containing protein [Stackebrandtia sp.]
MIKHVTASAFVFHRGEAGWRTGLIRHPIFDRWLMPGGHVEDDENPQQSVVREVVEETGLEGVRLWSPPSPLPAVPDSETATHVAMPLWIVEHPVPDGDNHLRETHVHVDHKYLAIADDPTPRHTPDHPFAWYTQDDLATLHTFDDIRHHLGVLFPAVDGLAAELSNAS